MALRPGTLRAEQAWWALAFFACGLAFWLADALLNIPLSVNVYGAPAYDYGADTWAQGFMAAGALCAYGVYINGRWRWSPLLRLTGWIFCLWLFVALVRSALTATDGEVIVIFGSLFFAPRIIRFIAANLRDVWVRGHEVGSE